MAKKIHELPQTKGFFQVKGIISENKKGDAFEEKETKNGSTMRKIQFAIQPDKENKLFLELAGFPKKEVYFYNKDKKETISVPFADRHKKQEDGYRMMGISVGLEKTIDKKGEEVNDKKTLCEYDATEYLHAHIKDDMEVFVKGEINFSSYESEDGHKRFVKLIPNQVSLLSKKLNMDDENFKPDHSFAQVIVYKSITKDEQKEGRYLVSAYIVQYDNIEEVEFVIYDKGLANKFKKGLKPYTALRVHGVIEKKVVTEWVQSEDDWGEADPTQRVSGYSPMEIIIIGTNAKTFDTETYTEEKMQKALRAIEEFGANKIKAKEENTKAEDDSDWGEEFNELDDIDF